MPIVRIALTRSGYRRAVVERDLDGKDLRTVRDLIDGANVVARKVLDEAIEESPEITSQYLDEHDALHEVQDITVDFGKDRVSMSVPMSDRYFPEQGQAMIDAVASFSQDIHTDEGRTHLREIIRHLEHVISIEEIERADRGAPSPFASSLVWLLEHLHKIST